MKTDRQFLSRRIAIRAALVALVAALCWILMPREPSSEGRTLSEWLMPQEDTDFEWRSTPEQAIRAMGAEAAAASLHWLKREDGWLSRKVFAFLNRHSFWEPKIRRAADWHYAASEVFRILGPDARSAIPELVSLTQSNSPTALRIRAINTLHILGPVAEGAVPALLACLEDPDRSVRMQAALALGSVARQPEVVVPKLLDCAQDTNRFDVPILLYAFCGFTNESARIIPALEAHLQQSHTARAASSVLWRFGRAADWPLARALTHPETSVRTAAAGALIQAQWRRAHESLRTDSTAQAVTLLAGTAYEWPRTAVARSLSLDFSRTTIARALALNLDHPNLELRRYFADLLLEYSDEALYELPAVVNALGNDDIYVAFRAWMVLDLMPLDEVEFASPLPRGRRSQR